MDKNWHTPHNGNWMRSLSIAKDEIATEMTNRSERIGPLVAIKVLHTLIWAIMAGRILTLPPTALLRRFNATILLAMIILAQCAVLAFNQGKCPLTSLAVRFTPDRADNLDIYLPNWLARYNKLIFGTLFVVNELFLLWYWTK